MSVIRFLHTDQLRLGSPLEGIADGPDWLRRTVAGAVRRAFGNLIETAIATQSRFVVVAGPLTQAAQDLAPAVTWLMSQIAPLRQNGIPLVLCGQSPDVVQQLRPLNSVVATTGQLVTVTANSDGTLGFHVHDRTEVVRAISSGVALPTRAAPAFARNKFVVDCLPDGKNGSGRSEADLFAPLPGVSQTASSSRDEFAHDTSVYHILPVSGTAPNADTITESSRRVTGTAGSPQATSPDECGACGCRLVEFHLATSAFHSEFLPLDIVRFVRQPVSVEFNGSTASLVSSLCEESRGLNPGIGRTVVVDWFVRLSESAPVGALSSFAEDDLLRELRGQLQSGHSGIWPRRVRIADRSSSALSLSRVA